MWTARKSFLERSYCPPMRNGTHHRGDLDLFSAAGDGGARCLLVGNRDDRSRDGAVAGGGPLDGTSAVFDD